MKQYELLLFQRKRTKHAQYTEALLEHSEIWKKTQDRYDTYDGKE